MYCFRCGKKLPPRVVNCPDCNTPQKRRQRYRTRMILGLFIFLAGAVAGSLFDSFFFKGNAWDHSFLNLLDNQNASGSKTIGVLPAASQTTEVTENTQIVNAPEQVHEVTGADQEASSDLHEATAVSEPDSTGSSVDTEEDADSGVDKTEIASESASLPVVQATESVETADNFEAAEPEPSFPSGKLVYEKVSTVVKGNFSSYHASVAKSLNEMVFAADQIKVDGKKLYQCFVKNPAASGIGERVFEWPGNIWTPEISPDGRLIVFSSDSRSPEHVFVYDRESKTSRALTEGTSKNMMSAISPDGKLVAYVSNEKGSNDIWLINIDGSNKIQITQSDEDDREPRWLPDGRGLVFTRIFERLKKSHIMKIMLDPMGEAEPLVKDNGRNWLADVSPDGSAMAFVRSLADDGSKNTLFVKYLATGEEKPIKPLGNAECFRPVWVPDCSGFVFHANVDRSKNIYKAIFKREPEN